MRSLRSSSFFPVTKVASHISVITTIITNDEATSSEDRLTFAVFFSTLYSFSDGEKLHPTPLPRQK